MVSFRRLLPVGFLLLFTGVVLAADTTIIGVLKSYDGKHHQLTLETPVKNKKDKFDYTTYFVPDKVAIIDEKGNDLKEGDLGKRVGKEVTLTIKVTKPKVGNVYDKLLTVVNFGKDAPKKEEKKVVVASKDRKDDSKKEDKAMPKAPEGLKGLEAKIVSLDAGKGELVVEISGAKQTIKVEKDTRFTGPRGGDRGEGPKVLEEESKEGEVLHMPAGKVIRVVYDTVKDKTRLKEIVLPLNVKE